MKCPACWAEKAYLHKVPVWKRLLLACVLLVPMKCHHCYRKYHVLWFTTLGEKTIPPPPVPTPDLRANRLSHAAQHYAATRTHADRHEGCARRSSADPVDAV